MKKLPVFILLLAAAACSSKTSHTNTPDNSITVSMKGISDLKIGMQKESAEKLLKHKLVLPHLSPDSTNNYYDTISCKYKDIDYTLGFTKEWQEDSTYIIKLSQISSHSPLLKTPSGIGISDDLCKIGAAYEEYRISITPTFDYTGNKPIRIKGKSEITLYDTDSNNAITFYMNNNKVEGMGVMFFEGD